MKESGINKSKKEINNMYSEIQHYQNQYKTLVEVEMNEKENNMEYNVEDLKIADRSSEVDEMFVQKRIQKIKKQYQQGKIDTNRQKKE